MRCYICDKSMTEAEIQLLPGTLKLDCCATCMEVVMETAYSDGFIKEEPLEREIEDEFGNGVVETLDPSVLFEEFGDSGDIFTPNYEDEDYE